MDILVRIGDAVQRDQPIARIYANGPDQRQNAGASICQAIQLGEQQVTSPPLVVEQLAAAVG
jgi:thymidine phosphorylase